MKLKKETNILIANFSFLSLYVYLDLKAGASDQLGIYRVKF